MSELPRLVANTISPWSERARWALDHHGIAYRSVEHVPFIPERRLRRMLRAPQTRVTVPVLLHGTAVLTESWDIAVFADRVGTASPLIPREREPEVQPGRHQPLGATIHQEEPARPLVPQGAVRSGLVDSAKRSTRRS